MIPMITGFGDFNKLVKSETFISKATPNMINERVRLTNQRLSESKLIWMLSIF